MDVLTAVNTLVTLTTTVGNLAAQAAQVASIVQNAQNESRTALSATEWAIVINADDAARKVLVDAINKALLSTQAATVK